MAATSRSVAHVVPTPRKSIKDRDTASIILTLPSISWPRGVTVSTLDSESSDRGSNPREAFLRCAFKLNQAATLHNGNKSCTVGAKRRIELCSSQGNPIRLIMDVLSWLLGGMTAKFRHRDSNPGRSGESRVS